jgi:hypothetical protein
MNEAEKANPRLWAKIKAEVLKGDKGGKVGQWSARKAQLAVAMYKKAGGKYKGKKTRNNSLVKWTEEEWDYTGKPKKSRYLPKKARNNLTHGEKSATSRAKNQGTAQGKQFVKQPKNIAKKTTRYRKKP